MEGSGANRSRLAPPAARSDDGLMPIHAVALLRIDPQRLRAAFPAASGADELTLEGPAGPVRAVSTGDALHLHLGVPFDTPPRQLGRMVRRVLGDLADEHSDDRGVYVYPDIARSDASTYEAIVDDLGEGGMWVPLAATEPTTSGGANLFDAIEGLMNGDMLAQLQSALGDSSGDPMASLAGLAGKLLEDPSLRETVQTAANALMSNGQLPDPSELRPDALLAQAQSLAGRLGVERPDLIERIARQVGGAEEE